MSNNEAVEDEALGAASPPVWAFSFASSALACCSVLEAEAYTDLSCAEGLAGAVAARFTVSIF